MANRFFPNYTGYVIASRFGMRTLKGVTKMHNGIDINASNDGKVGQVDNVMAHTAGEVYSVGYDSGVGNYIKIRVDSRSVMVYYHLKKKPAFEVGQKIQQGQIIGRVGKTGNATGAHLHWGIQKDGVWVDPEPYLAADWIQPLEMVAVDLPVLKKGDKGDYVKTLQNLLNWRLAGKCELLDLDGSFGGKTLKSVVCFQELNGFNATGIADKETWNKLLSG